MWGDGGLFEGNVALSQYWDGLSLEYHFTSLPAYPVNRSPLSELLVYPQPAKKKSEGKKYAARVLTSVESIALLEEKKRKKIEEIEEKQRKKKEREMKKIAKEEEKKRKALEREAKKAEAENKKSKGTTKKRPAKSSLASNSKRQKFVEDKTDDECEEVGLQHREISESECAACFGQWEDDEAEEWLKCTNDKCGVWSHAECLEKCDNAYVYVLCQHVQGRREKTEGLRKGGKES